MTLALQNVNFLQSVMSLLLVITKQPCCCMARVIGWQTAGPSAGLGCVGTTIYLTGFNYGLILSNASCF